MVIDEQDEKPPADDEQREQPPAEDETAEVPPDYLDPKPMDPTGR